jgi:hypothetical protein
MDASFNFGIGVARVLESKVKATDWVHSRQMLQRIATRMSLVGETLGFLVLGILIIVNRHLAALNGLPGGSSFAMIGGISAVFVATVFLIAACLHWRFCARNPLVLPVRRQSFRFIFVRPTPLKAIAPLA